MIERVTRDRIRLAVLTQIKIWTISMGTLVAISSDGRPVTAIAADVMMDWSSRILSAPFEISWMINRDETMVRVNVLERRVTSLTRVIVGTFDTLHAHTGDRRTADIASRTMNDRTGRSSLRRRNNVRSGDRCRLSPRLMLNFNSSAYRGERGGTRTCDLGERVSSRVELRPEVNAGVT